MDIQIVPPSPEAMFILKTAELVCEVTEKVPGLVSVTWHDGQKDGKIIVGTPGESRRDGKRIVTNAIDILYEDWSKGAKFTCVVVHKDDIEQPSKTYSRESGKADVLVPHFLI